MKIKNFLLVVLAGVLLTGASCKKILNQPVLGSYTPGDFFTSDANAQLAVNEAYKYLAFNSGATNAIWVLGDLASDDAVKGGSSVGDQPDYQAINQFEILPTNAAVEAVWGNYYNGVFACNVVTDGLTGNSAVSATMQQQGIAQAKFLRAYYYFILTLCYGNIPLHLTVQTATEAQTPALPQDTIFTQIENDCIAAAAVLPTSVPAAQLGQATKGAALALLAKTYLFHSDLANHYTLAAQMAQQVVALGYSLTNRYWDNFDANTKNNSEEIFTVNHIAGTLGLHRDPRRLQRDMVFFYPHRAWSTIMRQVQMERPIHAWTTRSPGEPIRILTFPMILPGAVRGICARRCVSHYRKCRPQSRMWAPSTTRPFDCRISCLCKRRPSMRADRVQPHLHP
jgi:hypothetical protein